MVTLALNADAKDGMWNMLGDHGSASLLHCAGLILYISLSSITPRLWFALLCKAHLSLCECSPAASWWRCFILLCSYKPSECVWGDVGLWLHVFLLTSLFEWWHTVSLVSKAHFNPSLTLTLNLLNSLLTSAESNKVCVSFTLNHREVKKTRHLKPDLHRRPRIQTVTCWRTDRQTECTFVQMWRCLLVSFLSDVIRALVCLSAPCCRPGC